MCRSHVGGRPPLVSVAEATAVGSAGPPALGQHTADAVGQIQLSSNLKHAHKTYPLNMKVTRHDNH